MNDIKSIADLQITVDTNAEQFANGIADVRGRMASFVGESSGLLTAFDASFGRLGTTATAVSGKIGLVTNSMTAGLAAINPALAIFMQFADKLDLGEDVKATTNAIGDLTSELKDAANIGFEGLVKKIQSYREGLNAAGDDAEGFKVQTTEQARSVVQSLTEMVKDATTNLKSMSKGLENLTIDETQRQIKYVEDTLRQTETFYARKAALAAQDRAAGTFRIFREDFDPIKAQQEISGLTDQLTKLREELMNKVNQNWTADIVFGDMSKYIDSLRRQTEEMKLQNETLGMSKARAAEHLAIRKAELDLDRQNREKGEDRAMTGEDRQKIAEYAKEIRGATAAREAHADAIRSEAEARRRIENAEKAVDKLDESVLRETEELERKRAALNMTARETDAAAFSQKLLTQARRDGLELTQPEIDGIYAAGYAMADLKEAIRQVEEQKRQLQAVSGVMSNAIMSEFASWTRGAEFNVRRMTANILAELAKIVLQKNVLEGLFGGGNGGGGGLLGNLLGGLFGGPRALGGPVEAGRGYLVGERGPEFIVPSRDGNVINNRDLMAIRGGSAPAVSSFAPSVTVSIDARGATADAIVELNKLKGELPGMILNTMSDARERGAA